MARYRSLRDFDWTMWSVTLVICALGILQIYSATRETPWRSAWTKQILCVCVGAVLAWAISRVDYHSLLAQVPLMYGACLALLVVTFVVGVKVFGSRRWIPLFGGVHFQISEFAKLVIILLVARYLSAIRNDRLELKD